jgi:hypothetical protein
VRAVRGRVRGAVLREVGAAGWPGRAGWLEQPAAARLRLQARDQAAGLPARHVGASSLQPCRGVEAPGRRHAAPLLLAIQPCAGYMPRCNPAASSQPPSLPPPPAPPPHTHPAPPSPPQVHPAAGAGAQRGARQRPRRHLAWRLRGGLQPQGAVRAQERHREADQQQSTVPQLPPCPAPTPAAAAATPALPLPLPPSGPSSACQCPSVLASATSACMLPLQLCCTYKRTWRTSLASQKPLQPLPESAPPPASSFSLEGAFRVAALWLQTPRSGRSGPAFHNTSSGGRPHAPASSRQVCIVYGALPPETRKHQAQLFNDPGSGYSVLVASDAVGLGLNFNIRRVIFSTLSKVGAAWEGGHLVALQQRGCCLARSRCCTCAAARSLVSTGGAGMNAVHRNGCQVDSAAWYAQAWLRRPPKPQVCAQYALCPLPALRSGSGTPQTRSSSHPRSSSRSAGVPGAAAAHTRRASSHA